MGKGGGIVGPAMHVNESEEKSDEYIVFTFLAIDITCNISNITNKAI